MMCEQITSITSVKLKLANSFEISTDELFEQYKQQVQNEEIYTRSSKLINHIKKLNFLFENFKHSSYFNYAKLKMVFKTDNPLLWLIPFEMESIFVVKDTNKFFSSDRFKSDTVVYDNV
jgi:hypothetical protein